MSKLERILSFAIGSEVRVVFKYHQTQEGFLVGGPHPPLLRPDRHAQETKPPRGC
jgi:hypothetical protein